MSERVEAANKVVDQFRGRIKGNGPYTLNCDPRDLIVAGFDAGRASRDAEVAELTNQRNEWASRMMEFASAEARAEAAEAVIAEVEATLQRAYDHGNGLDHFQVEDALGALAAPAVSHPEPTEEAK